VGLGLGWTLAIVAMAATGLLGAEGALVAALLHNAGTLAVMANAGRLLRFDELTFTAEPATGSIRRTAADEEVLI
jgi:Zn2+/Cd2+-exporting ATPase